MRGGVHTNPRDSCGWPPHPALTLSLRLGPPPPASKTLLPIIHPRCYLKLMDGIGPEPTALSPALPPHKPPQPAPSLPVPLRPYLKLMALGQKSLRSSFLSSG